MEPDTADFFYLDKSKNGTRFRLKTKIEVKNTILATTTNYRFSFKIKSGPYSIWIISHYQITCITFLSCIAQVINVKNLISQNE